MNISLAIALIFAALVLMGIALMYGVYRRVALHDFNKLECDLPHLFDQVWQVVYDPDALPVRAKEYERLHELYISCNQQLSGDKIRWPAAGRNLEEIRIDLEYLQRETRKDLEKAAEDRQSSGL